MKITGSSNGGALTRSEYPYLTILPSSVAFSISPSRERLFYSCIPFFSHFFAERAVHRLRFTIYFRVPSAMRSARSARSIAWEDWQKCALNVVYLGYSKRRVSNKEKSVGEADASGASTRVISRGGNSPRPDSRQLATASNTRCRNAPFGMVTEHDANGRFANRLFTRTRRPQVPSTAWSNERSIQRATIPVPYISRDTANFSKSFVDNIRLFRSSI